IISIIAIHGVDGNWVSSWMAAGSSRSWLQHPRMLPRDIPNARILTYGYNATIWGNQRARITMDTHAENLITLIVNFRANPQTPLQPIIFLAHSIGGIILKF
ncbi:hypothetical protein BU17DRAFT_24470, partial [Hysterangium stoloniferum]